MGNACCIEEWVMERTAVASSMIREVGYDQTEKTLEIEFNNGHLYRYHDVPETTYRALIAAPSLGSFFNAEIRDQYATSKIG
jgi:hypothetical protein